MTEILIAFVRDAFLIVGALSILIGSIGVVRFPDFFTRVHAAGVTETVGIGFIIGGLVVESGLSLISAKLVIILLLVLLTSPTSSHALAKTAINANLSPIKQYRGNQPSN